MGRSETLGEGGVDTGLGLGFSEGGRRRAVDTGLGLEFKEWGRIKECLKL